MSYYVVYNPEYCNRSGHNPFEVYHLENGAYVLQSSEPVWMPEIGLGIGRGQGTYRAWTREWLYWYDQKGNRLCVPTEVIEQEWQVREELLARLKERGIDIDAL